MQVFGFADVQWNDVMSRKLGKLSFTRRCTNHSNDNRMMKPGLGLARTLMGGLRSTTWCLDLFYGRSVLTGTRIGKNRKITTRLECARLTSSLHSDTTKINIDFYSCTRISVCYTLKRLWMLIKNPKKRGGGKR